MSSEYIINNNTPRATIDPTSPFAPDSRLNGRLGSGSDAFPRLDITASRSTNQLQYEVNKLSFWVRETRLIIVAIISIICIIVSVAIIITINDCSVNAACFSIISTVVGAWVSLLTRKGGK